MESTKYTNSVTSFRPTGDPEKDEAQKRALVLSPSFKEKFES